MSAKDYESLEHFVEIRRRDFVNGKRNGKFEDEELVWAVQDYLSSKGEFSEADRKYLVDSGNVELLDLEDEEDSNWTEEDEALADEDEPKEDNFGFGEGERLMVKMEGKWPVAVFPDIPWGIVPDCVTGWCPAEDAHVAVDAKYAETLPDAPKAIAVEVMRQLHQIGYKQLMLMI